MVHASLLARGNANNRISNKPSKRIHDSGFRIWKLPQVEVGDGAELDFRVARLRVGEVSRGEKMTFRGTYPVSYITELTLVHGD
jgi:hypothetical protein